MNDSRRDGERTTDPARMTRLYVLAGLVAVAIAGIATVAIVASDAEYATGMLGVIGAVAVGLLAAELTRR